MYATLEVSLFATGLLIWAIWLTPRSSDTAVWWILVCLTLLTFVMQLKRVDVELRLVPYEFVKLLSGAGDYAFFLTPFVAAAVILWIWFSDHRSPFAERSVLLFSALSIVISTLVIVGSGSWMVLGEWITGLLTSTRVIHAVAQRYALSDPRTRPPRWLFYLADILFVIAALLRWDIGDAAGEQSGFLPFAKLLGLDAELSQWLLSSTKDPIVYNCILYIPVAVCWVALTAYRSWVSSRLKRH